MASPFQPFNHKQPPSFETNAATIISTTQTLIASTSDIVSMIIAGITPDTATFDNTIRPLAENENIRSGHENHSRFYASTHPSKELRDASYEAAGLFSDAETNLFSDVRLFALVDNVVEQVRGASPPLLDEESAYLLAKYHQQFLINGCGITDAGLRATFVTKKKKGDELAKQCRKNMANEKTGLWLARDKLAGLPATSLSRLGKEDQNETEKFWIPTKTPFSNPVVEYASREVTRKKMYYAVRNRMPENISLHRELVLLRDDCARLLGWSDHFAFKTSQKVLKRPEAVRSLLAEIRAALEPVAQQSADALLKMKVDEARARGDDTDSIQLFFWDVDYFQKKLDEEKGFTESLISEYFELNTTLSKLLDMYVRLFGVRLVPVAIGPSNRHLIWHEDVQMFSAWNIDETNPEFLGYAYLDFHPRDGKFTHAGHYTLQKSYQTPDGSWFHPSSCLVMNYMKPSPSKPTLLDLDQVRSLFHELGHMYHNLLSRTKYARLHSVNSDFVETPSMMLEQFFWDSEIIRETSRHYSYISGEMRETWLSSRSGKDEEVPPEKISLEQATKLGANETSRRVRKSHNELFFSTYDMLVHSPSSHEELEKTNLPELFNRTRNEIFRVHGGEALGEGWEYCQGQTVFRAIQGKYDAGYYAYILGRLFAIEIFKSGFKTGDLLNKDDARRYRDMVLCKGGSQPEMKTLTDYLGHEPSSKPYLAWLGVQ